MYSNSYLNLTNLKLIPLLFVFIAYIIENFNTTYSFIFKLSSIALMIFFIIIERSYNKKILALTIGLLILFLINLINPYNYNAAFESLIKFLFIPVILLYAIILKKNFYQIAKIIIFFALLSNIMYLYNALNFFLNIGPQIIEYRTKDSGYLFNAGLFDVSNAVLQFTAFIIVYEFDRTKLRVYKLSFFFILTLLTFSYKTLPFLFLYIFFKAKYKQRIYLLIFLIVFSVFLSEYIFNMYEVLNYKISVYLIDGGSARYESYRVMFTTLFEGNFFGMGLGTFGGPESIKYNSPLYEYYKFDWGWMDFLKTTDTSYPHLFVELGLVGGVILLSLIYLSVNTIYNYTKEIKEATNLLLYSFLFSSIFSYGLFNLLELSIVFLSFISMRYHAQN